MRKIISFTLSLLAVISPVTITAAAAETESKTVVISKSEYESFSPEKETEINGKKYLFKEKSVITAYDSKFEIVSENLPSKSYNAAASAVNPDNSDQSGRLENVTYKENVESNRSKTVSKAVDYTAVPLNYAIPETYSIDYDDRVTGKNITSDLQIKDTEKSSAYWIKSNNLEGTVTGYNGLYYRLKDSNELIPKSEEKPLFSGYERAILESLKLDSENYRITNSYWSGDTYYDSEGRLCRNCIYETEALVCDIHAIYEDELLLPDAVSYTAAATYIDEDNSKIALNLIYEKAPIDKSFIAIGIVTGILIISALIAAILMLLSKRKSNPNAEILQN